MSKFLVNNSQKLMEKRDLSYIGQVFIIDSKVKTDDKMLFWDKIHYFPSIDSICYAAAFKYALNHLYHLRATSE